MIHILVMRRMAPLPLTQRVRQAWYKVIQLSQKCLTIQQHTNINASYLAIRN